MINATNSTFMNDEHKFWPQHKFPNIQNGLYYGYA
jgi:hypothetical protein